MAKKILVVEDTTNIRRIVVYTLRNRGYEVVESGDGLDAWTKATTIHPDLIVLDAMIPHKTGFEICTDLKRDDRWKHIPVVMLTAITRDTGKTDEFWRDKSKADDFISKPFRVPDLLQRIEKLLAAPPAGGAAPPPAAP